MSAQELEFGKTEVLKSKVECGALIHVSSDTLCPSPHDDPKDNRMEAYNAMRVDEKGAALYTAYSPTLLDLYRKNPVAVRKALECQAHRTRNEEINTFFARIFSWPSRIRVRLSLASVS
ncbi:MAG: hypothetical protein IH604_18555 [Burkholderiales bacterium]|nr:hypothetical protein [Burkholderiales bacterium]